MDQRTATSKRATKPGTQRGRPRTATATDPVAAEGTVYPTTGGRYWAVITWRRATRGQTEEYLDEQYLEHRLESATFNAYGQAKNWGVAMAARLGLAVTWTDHRKRDSGDP